MVKCCSEEKWWKKQGKTNECLHLDKVCMVSNKYQLFKNVDVANLLIMSIITDEQQKIWQYYTRKKSLKIFPLQNSYYCYWKKKVYS